MILAEAVIEDLARTVTCPVCERKAGKPCLGDAPKKGGGRRGSRGSMAYSHLGRLKLARGEK